MLCTFYLKKEKKMNEMPELKSSRTSEIFLGLVSTVLNFLSAVSVAELGDVGAYVCVCEHVFV